MVDNFIFNTITVFTCYKSLYPTKANRIPAATAEPSTPATFG
ncbi:hypothetical protein D047_0590A, partial [Vibrio parahaemolyticus VPTS-2010_2]